MSKSLSIPSSSELAINTGDVLTKLPTEALHNQLHQLAENSKAARVNLESTELAALILCALELEHQKEVQRVAPWKEWVKSNCEFSHKSATNYARVLKAARLGAIKNLSPDVVPDQAPSLMSKDDLRDAGNSLANALQGLGGIRQLYLQLEIIALPGAAPDNSNHKPAPTASRDAEAIFAKALKPIDKFFHKKTHLALTPPQARLAEDRLRSILDDLKLIK